MLQQPCACFGHPCVRQTAWPTTPLLLRPPPPPLPSNPQTSPPFTRQWRYEWEERCWRGLEELFLHFLRLDGVGADGCWRRLQACEGVQAHPTHPLPPPNLHPGFAAQRTCGVCGRGLVRGGSVLPEGVPPREGRPQVRRRPSCMRLLAVVGGLACSYSSAARTAAPSVQPWGAGLHGARPGRPVCLAVPGSVPGNAGRVVHGLLKAPANTAAGVPACWLAPTSPRQPALAPCGDAVALQSTAQTSVTSVPDTPACHASVAAGSGWLTSGQKRSSRSCSTCCARAEPMARSRTALQYRCPRRWPLVFAA